MGSDDKNTRYARDYQCSDCPEQAEVFWPIVDPDIESFPFCRECVETQKAVYFIFISEVEHCMGSDNE